MDWTMPPVVILAVLVARFMTTFLGSHGLYHRLIDVASLPFLDEHTHWRLSRWTANDVLQEDLRHAQKMTQVSGDEEPNSVDDILLFIRKAASSHEVHDLLYRKIPGNPDASPHAFPVVESNGELCGLVTREALSRKLKGEEQVISSADGDEPAAEERNVRHMFSTAVSAVGAPGPRRSGLGASELGDTPLGIEAVMDTAPFVVQPSTPVHQIHMMFRQLGLRHVVVVDAAHRPHGMLTRKSLMPWRCPTEPGVHDSFAAIRHARSPAEEGLLP
jgi:CBS domain-containing protein